MKEQIPMGMNRTGMQMSPFDANAMTGTPASMTPATPGDDSALAEIRGAYIAEADPKGRSSRRLRLNREQFSLYLARRAPAEFVLEACGGSHYWARVIECPRFRRWPNATPMR